MKERWIIRLKQKRPFWASLWLIVVYFVLDIALSIPVYMIGLINHPDQAVYFSLAVNEALSLAAAVVIAFWARESDCLMRKGIGFWQGLKVSLYPLFTSVFSWIVTLSAFAFTPILPTRDIAIFILTILLIGIVEELLFRGVLVSIFARTWAHSTAGLYKAIVLPSILFALVHLPNALAFPLQGVLYQTLGAFASGILYTAIYLRTDNLWVTVALHTINNFAAMAPSGIFGLGGAMSEIATYTPSILIGPAIYVAVTLFLIRPTKAAAIIARYQPEETSEDVEEPDGA